MHSGYIAVDGHSLIPADSEIIRTRRKMRDDGCVFASFAVDKKGQLQSEVALSPGLLAKDQDAELIAEYTDEVSRVIENAKSGQSDDQLKETVRLAPA